MKKILLIIMLLNLSSYASAMTQEELNFLKEYPRASKTTLVQDYLFIEDNRGNILEQCFIPKDGMKSCHSPIAKDQNSSSKEGLVTLLKAATEVLNGVGDSYNKQAEFYKSLGNNSQISQPISNLNKSKTTYNCIDVGGTTTCREQ